MTTFGLGRYPEKMSYLLILVNFILRWYKRLYQMDITQSQLKELFHYSPGTGQFYRKTSTNSCARIGDKAGSVRSGYIVIGICGKSYLAHRLAFLYMQGEMPPEQVDHINHIRDDNRWLNLREASHENHGK